MQSWLRRLGTCDGADSDGKIEAIVGVSCLSVLERAFPYMEAPRFRAWRFRCSQDDCKDTTIDVEWVWDMIHLTS